MGTMMTMSLDEDRFVRARWDGLSDAERAARLGAALERAGVSQAELVKRLDVSYPTVNRWKQGHAPITWLHWIAICHALRLPVETSI